VLVGGGEIECIDRVRNGLEAEEIPVSRNVQQEVLESFVGVEL
jgi:hypothetical protein